MLTAIRIGNFKVFAELVPEIVAKSTQFLPDGLAESNVFSPGGQPRL